ncbi:MAG: NUDIX hydrolase [Clostridiales Family XIII bacterium]|jgi:ADP-ribose pyrophosphatase|nr:NUDIX hydrolase [Clostridiales Family XIII bacterium]
MIFEEATISSERIYEGKILNLRRDEVTVRDGRTSYREIVEHSGGVVIAALTADGKVPMVTQYRKAAARPTLEIPAGKLEIGEDPAAAALRELREETGYTAAKLQRLTSAYSSIGYSTEVLHFYLATELTQGETDFDEGEAIDVSEYPLGELRNMAMRGELNDAKTIVAVLMLHERFGSADAEGNR